ncbi:MAG: hypothetical protein KIT60_30105 [Burkholderiaceae bacterium]|nr:hypothetical protein [Burkholderiaceae bacterium]
MTRSASAPFGVRIAPAGAVPAWWRNLAPGAWTTIAAGEGRTLDSRKPAAAAGFPSLLSNHASLATAWTGACVDQARREYLLCASGGHADYAGNECYGLRLSEEQPAWVRLCEPTPLGDPLYPAVSAGPTPHPNPHLSPPGVGLPWRWMDGNGDGLADNWNISANYQTSIAAAVFGDGRSRAMHTAGYPHYVEVGAGAGRIWFPMQNSVTSGDGGTVLQTVSFDRNEARQVLADAIPGSTPPTYNAAVNPWRVDHGRFAGLPQGADASGWHFCVSALDPVTGDIWSCPPTLTNNMYGLTRTNPTYKGAYFTQSSNWSWFPGAFMVVAHDPDVRLLIVGICTRNEIYVKRLDDDAQRFVRVVLPNDGFNWDPSGRWSLPEYGNRDRVGVNSMPNRVMSACYHAPSQSVLLAEPFFLGGAMRRLRIPVTTNRAYNPAGAWSWETLGPQYLRGAGTPPTQMEGVTQGTFTKVRMIDDMGDGNAALVYTESTTGPTFVYKVPL